MITSRDLLILRAVAEHYCVTTRQVRQLCFAPGTDPDGRIARRRLNTLVQAGWIIKNTMAVTHPDLPVPSAVYSPTQAGLERLVLETSDVTWRLKASQKPQWQNLVHWTRLTDFRICLSQAFHLRDDVALERFVNEFDHVQAGQPSRLYSIVATHPHRIFNCPDAAFVIRLGALRRVIYLEVETGANAPRTAARKSQGYYHLAQQKLHWKLFPGTMESFGVLCVAPDARYRDAYRRAFLNQPGVTLWKFVSFTDLTPNSILGKSIYYPAETSEPVSLVPSTITPPVPPAHCPEQPPAAIMEVVS